LPMRMPHGGVAATSAGTAGFARTAQGLVHRRQFGAFPVQLCVAGVESGQRGFQIADVDGSHHGAGGRPAVADGCFSSRREGFGVRGGEDAVPTGGAFDRWENPRVHVVADLLDRDPGRPRKVGDSYPVPHVTTPRCRVPDRSPWRLTSG
jgi:hypothetical protein